MSGFISANPDDDFISDREAEWRKYARGMDAFRDRQAATISKLQAEIVRYREALRQIYAVGNGHAPTDYGHTQCRDIARAALGGSND